MSGVEREFLVRVRLDGDDDVDAAAANAELALMILMEQLKANGQVRAFWLERRD